MGGIAGPLQQAPNTLQPGSQIFGGTVTPNTIGPNGLPVGGTMPGQMPQQPGNPFQRPLPPGYQSPYANYGFDSGFQSYLDNQYLGSMTDAGVNYQYDPTNQTFTGGTMGGRYSPIPLNVMQQAAGGDRSVLAPYFQSRFPQQPGPVPQVQPRPGPFQAMKQRYQGQPQPQPQPQTQPQNIQRGLGGLQIDKFRSRLGQR